MSAYSDMAFGISQLNGALMNAANMVSVAQSEKEDRDFMKEMYARQRADNLNDYWMQVEWNLPQNQMNRLRAAGLNPHLVYGSGAVANANNLPHSATTGTGGYSKAAQMEKINMIGDYVALRNLDLQNQKIEADVQGTRLDNEYKERSLDARVSYQYRLDESLMYLNAIKDNEVDLSRMKKNAEMDMQNIKNILLFGDDAFVYGSESYNSYLDRDEAKKYFEDIKNSPFYGAIQGKLLSDEVKPSIMYQQLKVLEYELNNILPEKMKHMQLENAIDEVKRDLWQNGINPNDPSWMRIIALGLTRWLGIKIDDIPDQVSELW